MSRQGTMKRFVCAFALLFVCAHGATTSHSDHSDHDHGTSSVDSHDSHEGEHFEAAAVYDVEAGVSSLVVVPAEDASEGEAVVFMIVPATSADMEGLEDAEMDAEPGEQQRLQVVFPSLSHFLLRKN